MEEKIEFEMNNLGLLRRLGSDIPFEHWWDAVRYALKNKMWGEVQVVLKDDGHYWIEDK